MRKSPFAHPCYLKTDRKRGSRRVPYFALPPPHLLQASFLLQKIHGVCFTAQILELTRIYRQHTRRLSQIGNRHHVGVTNLWGLFFRINIKLVQIVRLYFFDYPFKWPTMILHLIWLSRALPWATNSHLILYVLWMSIAYTKIWEKNHKWCAVPRIYVY